MRAPAFASFAKRVAGAVLALCVLCTFAPSAWAKFAVPPNEGPVTDTANALAPDAKEGLARKLEAIRAQTSYEVTVFVCGSLGGEPIADVAYETFNTWKLGQAGKDNGVLLVVAPNDRMDWIEVGKGVEGALTDLETDDIRRKVIEPRLKAGDLAGGLDEGAAAIAHALVSDNAGEAYARQRQGRGSDFSSVVFFVFVIVIVIIVLSRGGRGGRGGPGGFFWFGGGGGGFGGGGFGGGGGGGGGGGWGGGGSSGGGGSGGSY